MFGLESLWLIATIIIYLAKAGGCYKSESGQGNNETFDNNHLQNYSYNVSKIADEGTKNNVTSERQYSAEFTDYLEVPSLKSQKNSYFDYYNFVPGTSSEVNNYTNEEVVVNKCCSWNFHFDIEEFRCVQHQKEVNYFNRSHIYINKINNSTNETEYLFVKKFPDCGNQSVLSVEIVSQVAIDFSGIRLKNGVYSKYCLDKNTKYPNKTIALVCKDPSVFCKKHTCFRKCCPVGESYSTLGRICHKSDNIFKPEFYNFSTLTSIDSLTLAESGVYLGDVCDHKGKYRLEKDKGEDSYLGIDGRLYVPGLDKYHNIDEFCLEYVKIQNFSGIDTFMCFPKNNTFVNSQLQFFLLSLGFLISCTFLLATFLVYLFSPKIQNLYGKTLMCYIACLFSAYLCLAVVELKSKELHATVCTNMGYAILFSFLAAFFWLNVMSFDIWKTFRLDRCAERSKTQKRRLQFFLYSLYAWLIPSVITGLCLLVNQTTDFPYESIKPAIGVEHCWFSKKTKAIYLFFIAPISLVITCNTFFYVQTAWKIWKVKSDVNSIEKQKAKRFSANKDQFMINGKLFIVMGITWSLEVISFFAPHPIWYLTDTANALHGVFIFAIFVLKKKVLHQISEKFRLPMKRMKELSSNESSETKKNLRDLNTEAKTCRTGTTPLDSETEKN